MGGQAHPTSLEARMDIQAHPRIPGFGAGGHSGSPQDPGIWSRGTLRLSVSLGLE